MAEIRTRDNIPARMLEFLILTAARTGEVLGAKWNEFDWSNKIWVVPAARMKAGKEHRVPLCPRALEILRDLPRKRGNDFCFVGKRGAARGPLAMSHVLRQMERTDVIVHGMRSTLRDWGAETTHYPHHVIEQALAHTIGNPVVAAYLRSDLLEKRRQLMTAWASY